MLKIRLYRGKMWKLNYFCLRMNYILKGNDDGISEFSMWSYWSYFVKNKSKNTLKNVNYFFLNFE